MEALAENHRAAVGRRWWLRMILWSAGLVALLSMFLLAPLIRLHYSAWRYRAGKGPQTESMRHVARWAAVHKLESSAVIRLLGMPEDKQKDPLYYSEKDCPQLTYFDWPNEPTPRGVYPVVVEIRLQDGRAAEVEECYFAASGVSDKSPPPPPNPHAGIFRP